MGIGKWLIKHFINTMASQRGDLGGKKAETIRDDYGTWNPEQKALGQQLGPYLTANVGKAQPMYSNNWQDYAASLTPGEQDAIAQQGKLAAMVGGWSNQFQPGVVNSEVDATERQNLERAFYGTGSNPGAKALAEEQYAGSGGYWGNARANAVMDAYGNNVTNPYQNIRSGLLQKSYDNSLNYATNASNINTANEAMQQIPRLLKQSGMDKLYTEWVRTRPEEQVNLLNTAMNYLNLSTVTEREQAAEAGNWGSIANIAGLALAPFTGGASMLVAPMIGSGIDAMTSPTGSGGGLSQMTGALNSLGSISGFGANSSLNMFAPQAGTAATSMGNVLTAPANYYNSAAASTIPQIGGGSNIARTAVLQRLLGY